MNKIHEMNELQFLFESYLHKQHFRSKPYSLYQPFDYMLALPAKRLRPVMLLMACELFGVPAKKALPQAFAVELFHNFTLIHDDIMDEAPLRRGKPTVHKKFGESTAILSGDVMLVYAYEYLITADSGKISKLINEFNACAKHVCEGQQLDMSFELNDEVTTKEYLNMIELKTATLVATSLKLGAIIGGASSVDSRHLYEFGKKLGIAFQLKDDLLDAFGEAKKIGKQRGGDIIQNKKTFLVLEAMRLGDLRTKSRLKKLYTSKTNLEDQKVSEVLFTFNKLGLESITTKAINKFHSSALRHLNQVQISSVKKEPLMRVAERLMNRER